MTAPALRWACILTLLAALAPAGAAAPRPQPGRVPDPTAIRLPDGYRIEAVVTNLSVPTTLLFHDGALVVAESGWADTARPRVLRITLDGRVEVLASGGHGRAASAFHPGA